MGYVYNNNARVLYTRSYVSYTCNAMNQTLFSFSFLIGLLIGLFSFFSFYFLEQSSVFIGIYHQITFTIITTLRKIDRIRPRKVVRYSFHEDADFFTFAIRILCSRLRIENVDHGPFPSHGSRKYLTSNSINSEESGSGSGSFDTQKQSSGFDNEDIPSCAISKYVLALSLRGVIYLVSRE